MGRLPRIGASYTFAEAERAAIERVVDARTVLNRQHGRTDRIVTPRDARINNVEALAAEVAFARLAGAAPIFEAIGGGPLPDHDTTVGGETVDVKWTPYRDGALIMAAESNSRASFLALMVGRWPTYTYAGATRRAAMIARGLQSDLGNGRRIPKAAYVARQGQLT